MRLIEAVEQYQRLMTFSNLLDIVRQDGFRDSKLIFDGLLDILIGTHALRDVNVYIDVQRWYDYELTMYIWFTELEEVLAKYNIYIDALYGNYGNYSRDNYCLSIKHGYLSISVKDILEALRDLDIRRVFILFQHTKTKMDDIEWNWEAYKHVH